MRISIKDGDGEKFIFSDDFYRDAISQPLVTEKREIFSFPFGDAELVRVAFPGVYIVYGDMQLYEARLLYFEMLDHDDLVEMHFTLAGRGTMRDAVTGSQYHFRENHHNMHYMPIFIGSGDYGQNVRYKFFEVHFTKDFFIELARQGSPGLMRFAEIIQSDKAALLSQQNLPISFAMHQCIRDIMHGGFEGGLKLLFLQSKCIELLTLQAQMYEDIAKRSSGGQLFTSISGHDKESIMYAREYLLQNALQPPSLTELARIAGINEFKLKQGFKQVFNNTVFGYLSDYKLNEARDLLLQGDSTIKEVSDNLGYSSVQHFSNAFRKKFGMPPGKLKK
jgi:AraC-like DNA-binding protein